MKKLIIVLFFALMFMAVGSAYADILDDNPQRYHSQGTNDDGNSIFIDKSSIHHENGNITTYVNIMRLSNKSNLFNQAKELVKPVQIPQYIVSSITIDCADARIKMGRIAIIGVDTTDEVLNAKVLWSDASASTEWGAIPNGIEPRAKALLCSPSF